MYNLYLVHQLTDAALDLLRIAGENETLQKFEDIHEILRDATADDRFLAVRDLTDSLRLSMLRCINTAYHAAPSEFPPEFAALLDEHDSFARASLCYDGAPDDYQRAHALFLFKGGDSFRKNRPLWTPQEAQGLSTVAALRFPLPFGRANRAVSSKAPCFIRRRRRFGAFPLTCHCLPQPYRYCTRCAKDFLPILVSIRFGLLLAPLGRSPHRQ